MAMEKLLSTITSVDAGAGKPQLRRRRFLQAAAGTAGMLSGCTGGQSSSDDAPDDTTTASTTTIDQPTANTAEPTPAAEMPNDFIPLSPLLGYRGSLPLYDLRKEITADRQQPGVNMDSTAQDEVDAFFDNFALWYDGATYRIESLPLYSVDTQNLRNYWVGEWEKDSEDGVEFGGGVFMFWEPGPEDDDVTGDLEKLPAHPYYFIAENLGDQGTTMIAVDENMNADGFDFAGDVTAFESEYGVSLSGN